MRRTVTDRLREDILKGIFPPGERLIELQLSERYDVGRAAIRSALVELDAQGLVQRETNRGATVRRITIAEAVEITEARAALEALVARLAAERATKSDLEDLSAQLEGMKRSVRYDDKAGYSRLNRMFHDTLARMARHQVAEDLIANLRNRAVHQHYQLAVIPGRPQESLDQHLAIAEAVVRGRPDAAERAMREHLESVIDVLRRWERIDFADDG
jgi:DNA-binding GntR family transcriptional regulator